MSERQSGVAQKAGGELGCAADSSEAYAERPTHLATLHVAG